LLRLLDVSLLEVSAIGIILYDPLTTLVLLQLSLLVQFGKKFFRLEGLF
jgi:hypothetical protein